MVRVPSEPAFWIDATEVTNARFARFVAATGHRTRAERSGAAATWRTPDGPGSTLEGRESHPVVWMAREDAEAFATWSGGRLPTAEEWERASRAGRPAAHHPWGDEPKPGGRWPANLAGAEDGYSGSAPVRGYAPNAWGLYDLTGNVWEWTAGPVPLRLGGSFLSPFPSGPFREELPDGAPGRDSGFRCAR
jgi:formylglycine-generating enzyme required for sulfatase activity